MFPRAFLALYHLMAWPVLQILALTALTLIYVKHKLSRKGIPLPPGPPSDPLIGHLLKIPPARQDVFFYELGKTYGDVVHLKVLGKSLIILNSVQIAIDLLDKRSHKYSDRPHLPITNLWDIGDTLVALQYGEEWRVQRKLVQQYFRQEKRKDHRPIQLREARILVQNLLATPEDRADLLMRFSTAVIIDIAYGHQAVSIDDPYIKIAADCSRAAADGGPIGGTPVDLFPVLEHFPSWFPGTYYATLARSVSHRFRKLKEYPFSQVMEQMAKGTARPSFLATQLEALIQDGGLEDMARVKQIQAASAIIYIGGAETVSSSLGFFFLAMVLYPECQLRAREEIDSVIGSGRLPEFYDWESLPYLECVLQETLRWNNAIPAGIPHRAQEDDIYNGMLIPKGSTIIANTRSMTLDESVYKDPSTFDPTRFLPAPAGRGEPYPIGPYGFGRRVCPGRLLADDSLWIVMATVLATMSISKAIGKDGKEIVPDFVPITIGPTSHPPPFLCRLEPRNETASGLLKQVPESGY
ncbi:cytochrome P450 [Lyophyllum atratum]|nr:cytochrome P450 [Lyophyllum atratum]